eukprot:TRINITY_DN652_c0_g1_i4.p1 TRINITY_DN652_c0_g1~~TRINITY_DN652_c0_g1_i4.p1  ORF type:complete len:120 (+),score=18.33 TRINITY_DN652_c0_g1_i4:258-617(+)
MEESQRYLEEHQIVSLFQHLTTSLIFHKPQDPVKYLIEELKTIQKSKLGLGFFTKEDLITMFSMFDITGKGSITSTQFKQALVSLSSNAKVQNVPSELNLEAFLKEVEKYVTVLPDVKK